MGRMYTGNRDGLRHVHAGVARVGGRLGCGGGASGTGGWRYGRGRADRWDKGVKAAERLGRIGAMWLGAACAC